MAITYEVNDRATRPFARWGLMLPPPPVRSPLYLPGGGNGLAEMFMGETATGGWAGQGRVNLRVKTNFYRGSKPVPLTSAGVWTGGISDCMVVCAAYYDTSRWVHFWFQHVEGGQYENILDTIRTGIRSGACPVQGGRFAVIAAGVDSGTDEIAAKLAAAGILPNNISIYVSGTGSRGFAFGVNFSAGLFGELTHSGTELPANWQW